MTWYVLLRIFCECLQIFWTWVLFYLNFQFSRFLTRIWLDCDKIWLEKNNETCTYSEKCSGFVNIGTTLFCSKIFRSWVLSEGQLYILHAVILERYYYDSVCIFLNSANWTNNFRFSFPSSKEKFVCNFDDFFCNDGTPLRGARTSVK